MNPELVLHSRHGATVASVSRRTDAERLDVVRSETQIDMDLAHEIAASDMLPSAYKGKSKETVRANLIMVFGLGRSLGVDRVSALYGFHVIENTPSPAAKLQAALVRRAGHRLRILERSSTKAVVEITRHDDPEYPCTVEYSIDDARRAGALDIWVDRWVKAGDRNKREMWVFPPGMTIDATEDEMVAASAPEWAAKTTGANRKRRDPWHERPRTMLWHRAVTECVGAVCPEVLAGLDFDPMEFTDVGPIVDTTTTDPLDILRPQPVPVEAEDDGIVDAEILDADEDAGFVPSNEEAKSAPAEVMDALEQSIAEAKAVRTALATDPEPTGVTEAELKAMIAQAGKKPADVLRSRPGKSLAAIVADKALLDEVIAELEGGE